MRCLFCEELEVTMKKMLVVAGVLAVITGVVAAVCKNRKKFVRNLVIYIQGRTIILGITLYYKNIYYLY